jgi:diguanylate cyclase (GGDEF)-like protein
MSASHSAIPPAGSPGADLRLAYLAYHDVLTGMPNRAALAERLEKALERARPAATVALLSIDLDDFKLVNDGLGHSAGDELLRQVAARLESIRRGSDLLARHGGDEFLLLLELEPDADGSGLALEMARRIAQVLESPFTVGDAEFRIGASVGAALYPRDALDAETLHRHADSAMYDAKTSGSGFAAYEPSDTNPLARLTTAANLRRGLEQDAFFLEYQPVYRLPGLELIGLEALIRWRDSSGAVVPPGDFIPVAEKTGVINALGRWVLAETCRQSREWDALGLHPNIGINISPRELHRPGFADELVRTVQDAGVSPRRLVLELTESAWTIDSTRVAPALERLTAEGFVLALDDFGAGYSSLSRLRTLPVDVIKIDRAFMQDLPTDPQAVAVVDAILALAHACNCDVVTEGVETEAQLAFLAQRGCRLAQGFHLGRPQPAGPTTALLSELLTGGRRSAA